MKPGKSPKESASELLIARVAPFASIGPNDRSLRGIIRQQIGNDVSRTRDTGKKSALRAKRATATIPVGMAESRDSLGRYLFRLAVAWGVVIACLAVVRLVPAQLAGQSAIGLGIKVLASLIAFVLGLALLQEASLASEAIGALARSKTPTDAASYEARRREARGQILLWRVFLNPLVLLLLVLLGVSVVGLIGVVAVTIAIDVIGGLFARPLLIAALGILLGSPIVASVALLLARTAPDPIAHRTHLILGTAVAYGLYLALALPIVGFYHPHSDAVNAYLQGHALDGLALASSLGFVWSLVPTTRDDLAARRRRLLAYAVVGIAFAGVLVLATYTAGGHPGDVEASATIGVIYGAVFGFLVVNQLRAYLWLADTYRQARTSSAGWRRASRHWIDAAVGEWLCQWTLTLLPSKVAADVWLLAQFYDSVGVKPTYPRWSQRSQHVNLVLPIGGGANIWIRWRDWHAKRLRATVLHELRDAASNDGADVVVVIVHISDDAAIEVTNSTGVIVLDAERLSGWARELVEWHPSDDPSPLHA